MFEKEQQYTINAHDNEFGHRKNFTMYVKSPDQGINEQTGVLLVVQNLRAKANNPFWHDIRKKWSNQYNVITVGLNYQGAGWTGRAGSNNFALHIETMKQLSELLPPGLREKDYSSEPGAFLHLFAGQDLTEHGVVLTEAQDLEFWKNYPDYGLIQAIDCLWALGALWQICDEKGVRLDRRRIYAYGVNEGGHIVQMCGRLAPHTFAMIADNSGYPYITLETMIGSEETREKRWLAVGDSSIGVYVALPKTYGVNKGARYYITEDMIEIRDLKRFVVQTSTHYVIIQSEGDNPAKRKLCEEMCRQGVEVEYVVEEDAINEQNVAESFERFADLYIDSTSQEMLTTEGHTDFELGTRITYETTNGQYVLDYSSGAPRIEFEGDIIALRLGLEEEAEKTVEINLSDTDGVINEQTAGGAAG